MKNLIAYSVGPLSASVCVRKDLGHNEIEALMNFTNPSGTENGWMISEDTHFRQGGTNPCPCDKYPEDRLHYLMDC